jgi:N-acyl-phosphatidylethanolamine-hydrolysing phospholipase D
MQKENTITWIGQASFLIKVDNKVILTDPFFDEHTDPFGFIQRFKPPGIMAKNLPPIDAIVISHNHRDHLSEAIIKSLPNKEQIQVLVLLKLKSYFAEKGYAKINELDWYDSASMGDLQFTSLPAVHYSGRSLWDKNETLWCSWAISSKSAKVYFSGDTAYSATLFKEIGQKIGPFDLSLITIGTYGNKKYGVNNHADPEEAVQIGIEIGTNIFVGMHWGTLDLSDEPPWEPPGRFKKTLQDAGITLDRSWVLKIGETRAF